MPARSHLFSHFGAPAKFKLVLLGSPDSSAETLGPRLRSLNLEHVSPAAPPAAEISRRPAFAAATQAATLARLRRWFFARKPDAGFVLTDFPATLLQAQVFDEWLDARAETLTGVLVSPGADPAVVEHYRTLGLLLEAGELAA